MTIGASLQTANRRLFLGANALMLSAGAIALKSGLLSTRHVMVATKFQDDHKQHNDALIATIRKLAGQPVEAKTLDEYAKALKVDQLRNEDDVLDLAARLELGATQA